MKNALLTDEECKMIIAKLGKKLSVRPKLITERLLNDLDKDDLRLGVLPILSLEAFICVWRDNGMPDYAHGLTEPLR